MRTGEDSIDSAREVLNTFDCRNCVEQLVDVSFFPRVALVYLFFYILVPESIYIIDRQSNDKIDQNNWHHHDEEKEHNIGPPISFSSFYQVIVIKLSQ